LVFGASASFGVEMCGDWSLETLKGGSIVTLVQRNCVPLDPDLGISTAEFVFECDGRSKAKPIDATIIPFKGTYNNQERKVSVLIEPARNPKGKNSFHALATSNGRTAAFLPRAR
jgi:hypothetical protein